MMKHVGFLLALLGLGCVSACSKDNEVDASDNVNPGVGLQCSAAGDPACGTTGVCVLGYCRLGCATDGECPQGALCIGDMPPFGCQLQQDMHCGGNQKCEAPLVCGMDNTCRIGCSKSDACPRNDQICVEGACYGKLETGASAWNCDGSNQGAFQCFGSSLKVCDVGGLGWIAVETCETPELCAAGVATGSCKAPACSASGDHCEGPVMKLCNTGRTAFEDKVCKSQALCEEGVSKKECEGVGCPAAGALQCTTGGVLQRCKADLTGWQDLETCATPALCQASVTVESTTCAEPVCALGDKRCTGAKLETCAVGRDGWAVDSTCDTPELCALGLAQNGTCAKAACAVGEKHCEAKTVIACNPGRTGFDVDQVCANICSNGACGGVCPPESQQCNGNVLQTCQPDGQWNTGIPCQYVCKTNYCTGSCTPNAKTCDGTKLRSCGADGLWDAGTECEFACVTDACAGICKPGAKECGGGKVLYECTSMGQWNSGTICQFSCLNQACTPECVPGTTTCVGDDQATCLAGGSYGVAEKCPLGQRCIFTACQVDPVPVPGGYDVDATEVTRAQYAAWLLTNPATSDQPSYCSFNTDFTPSTTAPANGCTSAVWPAGANGRLPVVCIDWCDAYAYCKAAGRRLCGKIGGGPVSPGFAGGITSQWYQACSSGGANTYPYGDGYEAGTCNGKEAGYGKAVEVASMMACQSPAASYEGIYDLSGNVWELLDSCSSASGAADSCMCGGGTYRFDIDYLRCDNPAGGQGRSSVVDYVGFRCCSDP